MSEHSVSSLENKQQQPASEKQKPSEAKRDQPDEREIGGRKGPEPTRFGDWEKNGRCIDF